VSFAGVRDGLVATIQAHGKWAASQISTCDFGIVELSASTVILAPGPNTSVRPFTFEGDSPSSRQKEVRYEISGYVFVKDPGDPTLLLGRLWTACDDIFGSVNRDDSLGGAVQAAHIATIGRPDPDLFYTLNGVAYAPVRFTVYAMTWE